MRWCRPAGARALVDRRQSHALHQALHPLAIDRVALRLKPCRHPPRAVKRSAQILAVDERHQLQFVGADLDPLIVERGAAEPQQFALPAKRQRAGSFDHRQPALARYSPGLRSKKSRSTISRPTCSYSSASLRSLSSSVRPS